MIAWRRVAVAVARPPALILVGAIPGILLTLALAAVLYEYRAPTCGQNDFIAALPLYGDTAFNALLFLVVAVCIAYFGIGWLRLTKDVPTRGEVIEIRAGRALGALGIVLVLYATNHAKQTCLSDAGIRYRATLGAEHVRAWNDVHAVRLWCTGGRYGGRQGMTMTLQGGARVAFAVQDYVGDQAWRVFPARQKHLFDILYAHGVHPSFGAFDPRADGDSACLPAFPGLRNPP